MLVIASAVTAVLYFNRPSSELAEPAAQDITVDALEVSLQTIRIPIQAQGTVTPVRQTSIISEVRGRITEVSDAFNVGDFVSKGDVILRIDPRDYQTELLRAQAAVASAKSGMAQEKGRAAVARQEWKRLPKGSQRSPEAKDLYLRIPQLELAEAQLLSAMADRDTATNNLERTVISAPYDCLIRSKHSELGQFVSPGTPLTEIMSIESAEVRLAVPQSKLGYLDLPSVGAYNADTNVDLYSDVAGNVQHWQAQLVRTEGIYDERSRVLYTVARIEDPYGLKTSTEPLSPLRIGTFVHARILGKELDGITVLPRHILRAGNLLWVVDEDMILRNRKVSLLRTGGDLIYVSAGLEDGDLVSVSVLDPTFSGSKVRIVSQKSTAERANAQATNAL
ncbi:MAG: RND family efflux transporter MFP subunit [Halioglobus sp.]|jgi:RND family efflux transporter MFP subunit